MRPPPTTQASTRPATRPSTPPPGPLHLGAGRARALRARLPAGLPPLRQPAGRRGPHPGHLRPGLPVARHLHARHLRGLAAPDHHQPLPRHGPPPAAHPLRRPARRRRAAARPRRPARSRPTTDTHLDPQVQAALDALSPEFRAAVVLCDIEGLSYEEIAATLGVKLGTVRSRIHRGRAQLREALAAPTWRRSARSSPRALPPVPRSVLPVCCRGRADRMSRHLGMQVSAYVDHRLDARAEHAFDQHLAVCLVCRHRRQRGAAPADVAALRPHPRFLGGPPDHAAGDGPARSGGSVRRGLHGPGRDVRRGCGPLRLATIALPAERPTPDPTGSRISTPAARPDRGAGLAGAAPVSSPCRGDRGSRRGRLGGRRHRPGRRRPGSRRLGLAPVDATSGKVHAAVPRDVRRVRTHLLTTAAGAPAPGAVKQTS